MDVSGREVSPRGREIATMTRRAENNDLAGDRRDVDSRLSRSCLARVSLFHVAAERPPTIEMPYKISRISTGVIIKRESSKSIKGDVAGGGLQEREGERAIGSRSQFAARASRTSSSLQRKKASRTLVLSIILNGGARSARASSLPFPGGSPRKGARRFN